MNQFDELIEQIDGLASKLEEQTTLLNHNLRRLQSGVAQLKYHLGICKVTDEPEVH